MKNWNLQQIKVEIEAENILYPAVRWKVFAYS